ncbi:transcription initiation factor TFIID subunit 7 [Chrysoperla carnea]|uniref:transcription initiation factor TFIID subunit 7 n=1 Tax=Chrysoperla carnea TaxID=189513 RepID=UPI001D066D83|nr:transcription initiation factor TFIID subunit 7 [Chrysoperla carnea]
MRHPTEKREENSVELESQFILRMPPEPSRLLREMIRSGVTNFKDRVSIRLENDVRYGEVRVDHYLLHAKIVDLPTIIESLKTIDSKSFYKTADICQMMVCKEEEDQTTTDDEAPSKNKKKDPNKVDKKFLFMHGITPPMKNVRRRRFRKTLKKKFVEQPEIEKEVKRLLRIDNDAVSVKWEIIIDEDEQKSGGMQNPSSSVDANYEYINPIKNEDIKYETSEIENMKSESEIIGEGTNVDVEQEIFGSAVSDSEDENINVMDIDESSRISGDDSRMYDSDSQGRISTVPQNDLVTEFSKDMFSPSTSNTSRNLKSEQIDIKNEPIGSMSSSFEYNMYKNQDSDSMKMESESSNVFSGLTKEQILSKISDLETQLTDLRQQQQQQEMELSTIENQALRQRFQDINNRLLQEMYEKENNLRTLQSLL